MVKIPVFKMLRIIAVLFISAAGMFFRYTALAGRDLWVDELASISHMGVSLQLALKSARSIFQFAGDTLLIYPFFKIFGANKWGLSIPHIIATMLGFYLLYLLCRKYFKTTFAYVVTFLIVSFNATLIFHAFEIRPYGVLASFSIAVFIAARYIVTRKSPSTAVKTTIGIFIFAALSFHLYCSLMVFFSYIFHLLCSRESEGIKETFIRNFKDYWPGVTAALPVWIYFASPDKSYLKAVAASYSSSVFTYIHADPVSMFKGVFGNLIGFKPFYLLAMAIPAALLLRNSDKTRQIAFFLIIILAPIIVLLLTCINYRMLFIQRLFIWEVPLLAFLIGWAWDSVILSFRDKKAE